VRACDTNVVVRAVASDDPLQSPVARRWFDDGGVFLSQTVLLETEWVLGTVMGWKRETVCIALGALLRKTNVMVERGADAVWALQRHAGGADFADMLHLAAAREMSAFATFDRAVAMGAGTHSPVVIETLR